jgi:exodeoxyribonuclease-3
MSTASVVRAARPLALARRSEPWDVVCLQEIKATHDDVPRTLRSPRRAHAAFLPAERKGYSGVAVYAKVPPRIVEGFGSHEFDAEGRYLEAHFDELTVMSVYLPSGSSGPHRQASKFRFLEEFLPAPREAAQAGREIILCGDWNIAHREIDLEELAQQSGRIPASCPRSARGSRACSTSSDSSTSSAGSIRVPDRYTWWSNRGQRGRRTSDGESTTRSRPPGSPRKAKTAAIYTNRRFSDHAPLVIDYDYTLR